jgi:hypothetical protein
MKQISIEQLEPNGFYWACRKSVVGARFEEPHEIEIIQISTVFGSAAEFWSVATMGSDEHFALQDYDFFHKVAAPPMGSEKRAALAIVPTSVRTLGH